LGHDPIRHGRFTIIAKQRENGLNKAEEKDALRGVPQIRLFSTRYDDIHHCRLCFRGIKYRRSLEKLTFRA